MSKKKTRILHISSRADHGGGPKHIFLLLKNMPDHIESHICVPNDEPYYKLFNTLCHNNIIEIPHREFSFKHVISVIKYINKNKINIVHSHGKGASTYARFACLFTKAINIHTPHGIHTDSYSLAQLFIYKLYEAISGNIMQCIIYVSEDEHKKAIEMKLWKNKKYRIIQNGVPSTDLTDKKRIRSEVRQNLYIPKDNLIITTVSRFDYQKNMAVALSIAKKLPNIYFLWIGDGPDRIPLERICKNTGVKNIIFYGFCDNPIPFLMSSDLYLSTSRWEGLPMAVIEAMSCAIPVVCSNVPGHNEIVKTDINGFLYDLRNTDSACSIIKSITSNSKLMKTLSEGALETQNKLYSDIRMTNQTVSLYLNNL